MQICDLLCVQSWHVYHCGWHSLFKGQDIKMLRWLQHTLSLPSYDNTTMIGVSNHPLCVCVYACMYVCVCVINQLSAVNTIDERVYEWMGDMVLFADSCEDLYSLLFNYLFYEIKHIKGLVPSALVTDASSDTRVLFWVYRNFNLRHFKYMAD